MGSISNPRYGSDGIVFDTGQVLFGYLRAPYRNRKKASFKNAALKAGTWLVEVMDLDGSWRKFTHLNHPHTYNTRVAWSLVKLGKLTDRQEFINAGIQNLEWSKLQIKNNLFEYCAFKPSLPPFVHTIAYAIRGFFESSILLDNM